MFPNQTAAWAAAADGTGVAPAVEHLVAQRLRRGELSRVDVPGCKLDACWHVTLLERQHQQRGGQLVPPLPRHAGSHAPDALAGRRGPAVPVPAAGLRHDLELVSQRLPGVATSADSPEAREQGRRLKQALIRPLRGRSGRADHVDALRVMALVQQQERAACESNPTGTAAGTRGCTN